MVPQAVIVLPKLPLNANGKLDRKALPEPEQAQAQRETIAPRNKAEAALLKVWQRVLNRDRIGVTDNFFELGGHSLMAVHLMGEIRKETGKDIPLPALFKGATIEYLATLLQGAGDVDSSILREIQGQGSRPPFFAAVLPGVNALGYLNLSKHMGPDQPFYMLQAPGPGPRPGRRPYTAEQYESLAADYIRAMCTVQPEGPYHLGGMCEGARIAFEMTRLLESRGQKMKLLAIMDTWVIENTQNRRLWKIYYYSVRLRQLWRQPWGSRFTLARKALRNRFKWWLGSKSAPPKSEWLDTYWPGDDFVATRVQSKITIFKAPKQPFFYNRDELLGWGSRTVSGVDTEILPNAKHRLLLREPYVRELAAALSQTLRRLHHPSAKVLDTEKKTEAAEAVAAL
jgi:thioesterase domain-containing protein/acyl carrier protein